MSCFHLPWVTLELHISQSKYRTSCHSLIFDHVQMLILYSYAAGNTFQDAFVQYRHRLGLSASVLDVGVMADIGYVSQNLAVENNMRTTGMWFLNERDLLDALHLSILTGQPPMSTNTSKYTCTAQLGIGFRSTKDLSDPSNRVLWRRDKRMLVYRNMEDSTVSANATSGDHDELNTLMTRIEADPALLSTSEIAHALTREIGITVYRFMLQPVEELAVEKALSALGELEFQMMAVF